MENLCLRAGTDCRGKQLHRDQRKLKSQELSVDIKLQLASAHALKATRFMVVNFKRFEAIRSYDWFTDSTNIKPFEFQVYEALRRTLPLELWSPTAENRESYQKFQLSIWGKKWSSLSGCFLFFSNKTDNEQGTLFYFKGICIICHSSIYLLGTI